MKKSAISNTGLIVVSLVVIVGLGYFVLADQDKSDNGNGTIQPPPGDVTVPPGDPKTADLNKISDLPLTSIPKETLTVKFVIEHRSVLDGKTVKVSGFVVGKLLGERACPGTGLPGGCAQPRIFLADSNVELRRPEYDLMVLVSEDHDEKDFPIGKKIELTAEVSGNKSAVVLRMIELES